jgi:hypothetical protein
MSNTRSKTRLYCTGGLGLNIGRQLEGIEGLDIAYMDTSKSNRVDGLPDDRCYFVPNTDGAGQDRRGIYAAVLPHVDIMLERFEPGDFNIVLLSASGGSGSVLGPLLIKQLLAAGEAVVAVGVGAEDSAKYIGNTIDTLKSLEGISAATRKPVVLSYHENAIGVPRSSIDDELLFVIESLAALACQNNLELDTTDVTNWVQFDKVTPVMPQLALMNVFDNRQEATQVLEPVAIASLYDDPGKRVAFGNPYYATVGFPRDPNPQAPDQLHFVINVSGVEDVFKTLTERQANQNRKFSGYRNRRNLVDVDDNLTGEGLVI